MEDAVNRDDALIQVEGDQHPLADADDARAGTYVIAPDAALRKHRRVLASSLDAADIGQRPRFAALFRDVIVKAY